MCMSHTDPNNNPHTDMDVLFSPRLPVVTTHTHSLCWAHFRENSYISEKVQVSWCEERLPQLQVHLECQNVTCTKGDWAGNVLGRRGGQGLGWGSPMVPSPLPGNPPAFLNRLDRRTTGVQGRAGSRRSQQSPSGGSSWEWKILEGALWLLTFFSLSYFRWCLPEATGCSFVCSSFFVVVCIWFFGCVYTLVTQR